jgi:hypothetical protein
MEFHGNPSKWKPRCSIPTEEGTERYGDTKVALRSCLRTRLIKSVLKKLATIYDLLSVPQNMVYLWGREHHKEI